MLNVKWNKRIITSNELTFSINGMISPRLLNIGNETVFVEGQELEPGDSFTGLENMKNFGDWEIKFDSGAKYRRVVIFFGIEMEPGEKC